MLTGVVRSVLLISSSVIGQVSLLSILKIANRPSYPSGLLLRMSSLSRDGLLHNIFNDTTASALILTSLKLSSNLCWIALLKLSE